MIESSTTTHAARETSSDQVASFSIMVTGMLTTFGGSSREGDRSLKGAQ
jgi:hypothetical protein